MKLFRCSCAASPALYYENSRCNACGRLVGFDPASLVLKTFGRNADGDTWLDDSGKRYKLCLNRIQHGACNWMLNADDPDPYCTACRRNLLIPDLSIAANLAPWKTLETAKRRCLFTLHELDLPLDGQTVGSKTTFALAFRFLADRTSDTNFEAPLPGSPAVLTGHENGVITINLAEADVIARTRTQLQMAERYRTPLGHFRHETGHYVLDLLSASSSAAADNDFESRFGECFGDPRTAYDAALRAYYANGPAGDWQQRHVSAYASAHPWEDWAETWSHYLHLIDTLETLRSFAEMRGRLAIGTDDGEKVPLPFAVGGGPKASAADFERVLEVWIDASIMLNSLNRSMGLPDPYPFVLNGAIRRKLLFVHEALIAFATVRKS